MLASPPQKSHPNCQENMGYHWTSMGQVGFNKANTVSQGMSYPYALHPRHSVPYKTEPLMKRGTKSHPKSQISIYVFTDLGNVCSSLSLDNFH